MHYEMRRCLTLKNCIPVINAFYKRARHRKKENTENKQCWHRKTVSQRAAKLPFDEEAGAFEHKHRPDMPSFIRCTILESVNKWVWLKEALAKQCIKMRSIGDQKTDSAEIRKMYHKPQESFRALEKQVQSDTRIGLTYSHKLDELFSN